MMNNSKSFFQQGQVLLIIVLILAVGLTIGLAVASQSTADISVSQTEENSLRALNAAEAGIEEILRQPVITAGTNDVSVGDLTANVEVTENKAKSIFLKANEVMEIKLSGGTASRLKISWIDTNDADQNPGTCDQGEGNAPASLEIMRIRSNGSNINIFKYFYNTCSALDSINNFNSQLPADAPTLQSGADPYLKSIIFNNIDSNDIAMRIRAIYNDTSIEIKDPDGGNGLPVQEYEIVSTTKTSTGETRSVEVRRSVEAWPPIFDYVLFSGSSLIK